MNKKILILGSTGILISLLGCSGTHQNAGSTSAPAARQVPTTETAASSKDAEAPLPVPLVGPAYGQPWRPEPVNDHWGGAIVLKRTSLDGKYDLVIIEKGTQAFLSFARHAHWDSVHDQPAKGKLMYLRVKFEDGLEKRGEWDELASGTENEYGVLWAYPANPGAPLGPVSDAAKSDAVGGDQFLMQDMMKHKTMLLEVEPGVTAQFDLVGLESELGKIRPPKAEPVLAASQSVE